MLPQVALLMIGQSVELTYDEMVFLSVEIGRKFVPLLGSHQLVVNSVRECLLYLS